MIITNPCGVAHFKNKACRECDRLRTLEVAGDNIPAQDRKSPTGLSGGIGEGRRGKQNTQHRAGTFSKAVRGIPTPQAGIASGPLTRSEIMDIPPTKLLMPAFSTEDDIEDAKKIMTDAERQRRWRTSGDAEAKREANKLRMRAKRKNE